MTAVKRYPVLTLIVLLAVALPLGSVWADDFDDTIQVFKAAGESGRFFDNAYGYAVFPTVGKGGIGIGGARGKGRVYAQGNYVGDTTMTQLSVGFQLGGQAFSQIIFFQDVIEEPYPHKYSLNLHPTFSPLFFPGRF